MTTPNSLIVDVGYELQNASGDFEKPELLSYINRSLEMIYRKLVQVGSEIVRTGTGSFDTVAGTQSYDLTSESMTDIWVINRVWIEGSELMDLCIEKDLYDTINAEENSETGHRCEPLEYCLIVNQLWFKESPDDAYTVQVRYFSKFTSLTLNGTMPYNDLANTQVRDMVLLLAQNRIQRNEKLHAQLLVINQQAMNVIVGLREKQKKNIRPGRNLMRAH
jgi:hypothetical protein